MCSKVCAARFVANPQFITNSNSRDETSENMGENKFSDITFSNPSLAEKDEIREWLCEHFFPDEPVSMSFDFIGKTGYLERAVQEMTLQDMVDNVIGEPHSVMARDGKGDIVGKSVAY